jgi:hypothetical protein
MCDVMLPVCDVCYNRDFGGKRHETVGDGLCFFYAAQWIHSDVGACKRITQCRGSDPLGRSSVETTMN